MNEMHSYFSWYSVILIMFKKFHRKEHVSADGRIHAADEHFCFSNIFIYVKNGQNSICSMKYHLAVSIESLQTIESGLKIYILEWYYSSIFLLISSTSTLITSMLSRIAGFDTVMS